MNEILSDSNDLLKNYRDNRWLIIKSPNRYVTLLYGLHNVSLSEEFDSLDKAKTFVENNRTQERILFVI